MCLFSGQINLDACNAVGRHDGSFQGREHVIELSTEERVFFLCAENEEDRNSWISILNQYTQRNSFDKVHYTALQMMIITLN